MSHLVWRKLVLVVLGATTMALALPGCSKRSSDQPPGGVAETNGAGQPDEPGEPVITLTDSESQQQALAVEALQALGATGSFKSSPDGFFGGLPGGIAGVETDDAGIVRGVDLIDTEATDDDLKHLTAFPYLQRLHLMGAKISDAGLENLSRLTALEKLDLSNTDTSQAGIAFLKDLKKLRLLRLDGTNVGDDALPVIGALEGLETLYLSDTQVTNAGLDGLGNLKQLKLLQLQFCKGVTSGGIKQLKKRLPDCKIIAGGNTIIEY